MCPKEPRLVWPRPGVVWELLALDLLAKLMDQAAARAIESGQEAAPNMTASPKSFPGDGIIHGEIGIGGPIAEMDGQIGSEPPVLGRTGKSFRFNFRGKHEYQIRLIAASDYLEAAPFFELAEGITAHRREAGLILEIDGLGRPEPPRQIATVLGLKSGQEPRNQDKNKD